MTSASEIAKPSETEYAPFYSGYIAEVAGTDVLGVLRRQVAEIKALAGAVPEPRETFRYAPGKWSIREVISHLTDGERVFGYRAFCIGRGETTPLPGFDENRYVSESGSDRQRLGELVGEFVSAREANLNMFGRFDGRAWRRIGNANGSPVSVRALAYIMAGHVQHHFGVLRSRYNVAG